MQTLINGKMRRQFGADNRNVQFGDGVFETCILQNSHLIFWCYHFSRFSQGADRLKITMPAEHIWLSDIKKLIGQNQRKNACLKLILSRGNSKQGYLAGQIKPLRIVSILPLLKTENSALNLRICAYRYGDNAALSGIKHCSRLDNIMASSELDTAINDGVMLDKDGLVISTTKANIFLVKSAQLFTPKIERCGIIGTRRMVVFMLCKTLGLTLKEEAITLTQLAAADEVFITNSLLGIRTVGRIGKNYYRKTNYSEQLQKAYKEAAQKSAYLV